MKMVYYLDENNREDKMAINRLVKSGDMAIALFQITHNLLGRVESRIDGATKDDAIGILLEEIDDIVHDNGIHIDELTD